MKEIDLFEPIKKQLIEIGCDEIYAEVLNRDVVAFMGNRTIIVELKKQLNFKVIEQAIEGRKRADYTFVAVPFPKTPHSKLAIQLLKENGIGLIYLLDTTYTGMVASFKFWGSRNKRPDDIKKHIKPHHTRTIGGSKGGEGPTEYSDMIDDIKRFMRRTNKWVSVDEILENASTIGVYYKRPKESIMTTLKANWNTGWCERSIINRKTHFRYKN